MRLIRILYQSQRALGAPSDEAFVDDLLVKAIANNRRDGVTALLLFDDVWFLQVLEGAQKVVWHTFERIKRDPRHRATMLLDVSDIDQRSYLAWPMASATRTSETKDIFANQGISEALNPPRMKTGALLCLMRELSLNSCSKSQPLQTRSQCLVDVRDDDLVEEAVLN